MTAEPEDDQNPERRRYFRIEDDIILFSRQIDADDLPEQAGTLEASFDTFSLSARLDLLTMESRSLLHQLQRDNPILAEYLEIIDQKVDLLARALLTAENDLADQPTRHVSLSASGLAFESEVAFELGDLLELKMILPPTLVGLQAYGRVVAVAAQRLAHPSSFRIGVDFVGLREQEREVLIRHVVKRQMQQLRDRKRESAAGSA